MPSIKTILVVDDNIVNRIILTNILSREYSVLEAENGEVALKLLSEHADEISAIMLDLVMPVMDGFAVLKEICQNDCYCNLPIVVTTENSNNDSEIKALKLGAWDFVLKPYNSEIIMFRLKNAIDRSQLSALKQLKYLSEYDSLTGIYNKTKFFEVTREMINESIQEKFAFLRFDVDRFQLINSFFGTTEGDNLLKYITTNLARDAQRCEKATYGRIESDIVGLCMPYDEKKIENMVLQAKRTLQLYNINYDIVPSIGIYVVDDNSISVEEMYNRATLAAKTCKGNYVDFYAYYNEGMSVALTTEQEITNDMNYALENGQFEIYLQPQYNIHTNLPCAAEALVRWRHPKKGMLSPGLFIPIFERNGFITKLDYYVWEEACKCLCARMDRNIMPYPISVNVSRVNIYNPNLAETLLDLVNQYHISPSLLHLELTESAYTDNPTAMKKTMGQLQSYGFTIMMDDFGSGYSSLSLLKDMNIDILKIDMQFLSTADSPGRGENIIASVIRMAKWLNIPVIAEGAETKDQVDFLKSVGCDFIQGYYFARPMPISEYDRLCIDLSVDSQNMIKKNYNNYQYDDLFSINQEMKQLFSNILQAAVIYEFIDDKIEIIRVNEAYYALLGHDDMLASSHDLLSLIGEGQRTILLNAFSTCTSINKIVECEYMRHRNGGAPLWIHSKLRYVSMVGDKKIIIGELSDITIRKELDAQLEKYKVSLLSINHNINTVLIVDDAVINRIILKKILQGDFEFLEAENGKEAIKIIKKNRNKIDLILLDLSMPVMNGREFLNYKKVLPEFDTIPVIIISDDDSPEQQITAFSLGAKDYIIKPFIPEVVTRRVKNVLESNYQFKEMVREYNNMSQQIKTDLMTGLINRASAEELVKRRLESATSICAMIMLDIDNFKKINDTCGHDHGDKVIRAVATKLRFVFGYEEIIVRMGGDEFAVFIENISNINDIIEKADEIRKSMTDIQLGVNCIPITCSVGVAISSENINSFELLYRNADKALYNAKCHGRNTISVYDREPLDNAVSKWINDAESIVDIINDSIYVCELETYELVYMNNNLCKIMGVTREDCKGKKCYEVLMKRNTPCSFCTMLKMEQNKIYTRVFRKPDSDEIFLMRGKTVNRNGNIIHLEVAVDVTKLQNTDLFLDEGAVISGEE